MTAVVRCFLEKSMSQLGSLVVSLEANIAQFSSGMDKAGAQAEQAMQRINSATESVKNALGMLGVGVSVGAFAQLVKGAIDAADNLRDMAQKTGIAVEQLNGLGFAASQAGGSLESMGAAAGKLNKSIAEAAGGNKETAAAFAALGISVTDASGDLKKADVVMAEIADEFEKYQDGPEKAAIALALFGKAGADMIPVLNDGGGAMRDNIAYAMQYSGVTSELADASDNFNDTMGKLAVQQKGFVNEMTAAMMPTMQAVADEMLRAAEESDKFSLATEVVRTVLETVVVMASETIYTFKQLGVGIGGMAAQLVSLASLDFTGFSAISDAIKADQKKAETEHADFIKRVLDRSKPVMVSMDAPLGNDARQKQKARRLPGNATGGKNSDRVSLAKAQLDADLAEIKSATAAITGTYANAEKIMEAMHAASRMEESEYYAAKLAFLNLNAQAQDEELQKEIARLQAEKLTGKEKIDNDKKIAEAQAKLSKVREDASAGAVVLSIQEVAANEKIARSYIDATVAAEAYIKSITERNAREVDGFGRGAKYREEQSGKNAIEDKFTSQRQGLERDLRNGQLTRKQFDDYLAVAQSTYTREIELYDARTQAISVRTDDWLTGANEAMNNYMDQTRDIAQQTEAVFSNAFKSMEDAIVSFTMTGKLDFKSMAESILSDLVRIQTRQMLTNFIGGSAGGASGGGLMGLIGSPASSGYEASSDTFFSSAGSGLLGFLGGLMGRASGGPVEAGRMYQVAEKGPELLNVGGKTYLMMGAQSGSVDAKSASRGGGQPVSITVNVSGNSSAPDVRRAAGQGAREALAVLDGAGRYR